MKSGLRLGISLVGRNWAGTAGGAGSRPAILAGTSKVLQASSVVVGAFRREGGDRASRETRTAHTLLARMRAPDTRAQVDMLTKSERPAVGMPETPLRMNEQAQRRAVDRLGL